MTASPNAPDAAADLLAAFDSGHRSDQTMPLDDLLERLDRTIDVIHGMLPSDAAQRVIGQAAPLWIGLRTETQ